MNSISISKLIFSRPIFLKVILKRFKLWWYELGNGKEYEFHHHLNVFFENTNFGL
jgi:hypothetical protein